MRAAVLDRIGPLDASSLRLAALADPRPGPGDLLLQVATCAVCRTDLHVVEGDVPTPHLPRVPGHQAVGRVLAAGEGVDPAWIGRRAGAAWLRSTCGACAFCRQGRENLCPDARFNGVHADGGFAERMVVPAAFAVVLPDGLDDVHAAPLLCGGVIGFRAFRLLQLARPSRVGLFGFGASAHLTLQLATALGHEAFVFSRSDDHRRHALALGAAWAGPSGSDGVPPLDAAICFAPAGSVVPHALAALGRGGVLALAGVTMTPVPELDYDRLLYHERVVRSVANATRSDADDYMRLATRLRIAPEVETFGLDDVNRALARLAGGTLRGTAVIVNP